MEDAVDPAAARQRDRVVQLDHSVARCRNRSDEHRNFVCSDEATYIVHGTAEQSRAARATAEKRRKEGFASMTSAAALSDAAAVPSAGPQIRFLALLLLYLFTQI